MMDVETNEQPEFKQPPQVIFQCQLKMVSGLEFQLLSGNQGSRGAIRQPVGSDPLFSLKFAEKMQAKYKQGVLNECKRKGVDWVIYFFACSDH